MKAAGWSRTRVRFDGTYAPPEGVELLGREKDRLLKLVFRKSSGKIGPNLFFKYHPFNPREYDYDITLSYYRLSSPIEQFNSLSAMHKLLPDVFPKPFSLVLRNKKVVGYLMEYVEGVGLDEFLKMATRARIRSVRLQIEQAVLTLHRNRLVHGDLNSGNIIVGGDCRVKFLDPDEGGLSSLQKVDIKGISDAIKVENQNLRMGLWSEFPENARRRLRG